jgi:hypothetical protein
VANQNSMTENLLNVKELANQVPETVGHIYPVIQGDSDQYRVAVDDADDWDTFATDDEHKMYIPDMLDIEHSNKI